MIFTNIDEYMKCLGDESLNHRQIPHAMGKLQVVATSGAFDILTPGHIRLFEYCRRLGTYVVVLLNTDESIQRYKSEHRPVKPWKDRAVILDSLRHVEHVIGMSQADPIGSINQLKPDIWVKGNRPVDEVVELQRVWANGGEFVSVWTNFDQSSTGYIEKAAQIYLAESSETGLGEEKERNIPAEMLRTLEKDKAEQQDFDRSVEQFLQLAVNRGWPIDRITEAYERLYKGGES